MSYRTNRTYWLSCASHNVYVHLIIQRTKLMDYLKRHAEELSKAALKK